MPRRPQRRLNSDNAVTLEQRCRRWLVAIHQSLVTSFMLWLCISLPQWPLEALHPQNTDTEIAVTACEGSTRWIICCNPAAERCHLKAAMNYTVALAIHPQMTALERKPKAEREALERLAAWA